MAIFHNGRRITSLRVTKDETSEGTGGSGGTPTLQGKTVTPSRESQVVRSDDGYDGLSYVLVEAIPATEQAEPSITVDQNGLITASVDQAEGYVTEGIKSTTHQLPTQGAKVITPGKTVQTAVEGGVFTTGPITVAAASGGGEIQTKEGSFTTSRHPDNSYSTSNTITCGFRPDVVVFPLVRSSEGGFAIQISADFTVPGYSDTDSVMCGAMMMNYGGPFNDAFVVASLIQPSQNGFTVTFEGLDVTLQGIDLTGRNVEYIAYKL